MPVFLSCLQKGIAVVSADTRGSDSLGWSILLALLIVLQLSSWDCFFERS